MVHSLEALNLSQFSVDDIPTVVSMVTATGSPSARVCGDDGDGNWERVCTGRVVAGCASVSNVPHAAQSRDLRMTIRPDATFVAARTLGHDGEPSGAASDSVRGRGHLALPPHASTRGAMRPQGLRDRTACRSRRHSPP